MTKSTGVGRKIGVKLEIPPDRWVVSRAEMLDFYPIHWETIRQRLKRDDCPSDTIEVGRNQYDIKIFTNWMIEVFYAPKGKALMDEEKLRHQKYKSDLVEYEAKLQAGELIPKDDVQSGLSFLLSGIKNKFLQWIKRIPPLLAHKSAREIEKILKEELYLILSDLAAGVKNLIPKDKEKGSA